MRVAIISDWFAEKMGYAENCLPKAMASLGHDVHVITSNAQPYFHLPTYRTTYEPFLGPGIVACGTKPWDGFTLHRLPHALCQGRLRIRGLRRRLKELQPEVVQTFDVVSPTTLEAAWGRFSTGYKLFLESHVHASVFRPLIGPASWRTKIFWPTYAATLGRMVNVLSEKCYPISEDAAEIVTRFFGITAQKVSVVSLGVDTDLFHPPDDEAARETRRRMREALGFRPEDIVCIYTGRFSQDKNPACLAQAIDQLATDNLPFRGLFVGSGPEQDVKTIQTARGCVIHPFVPTRDLPPYYWAADIGVWPKQESTSQLDAAACGLPLILSDRVKVVERVHGNGLLYAQDDPTALAQQIRQLTDPQVRRRMGDIGTEKVRSQFSWREIARQRLQDYEAARRNNGRRAHR